MKTIFGGFAGGCAFLATTPTARAIIPVTVPRSKSRRVIGSFPPNAIEPPLTSMKYFSPDPLGFPQDQAVDAAAHVAQVGFVAASELADRVAPVANFANDLAYIFPVHITVAYVHPHVAACFAPKIFQ